MSKVTDPLTQTVQTDEGVEAIQWPLHLHRLLHLRAVFCKKYIDVPRIKVRVKMKTAPHSVTRRAEWTKCFPIAAFVEESTIVSMITNTATIPPWHAIERILVLTNTYANSCVLPFVDYFIFKVVKHRRHWLGYLDDTYCVPSRSLKLEYVSLDLCTPPADISVLSVQLHSGIHVCTLGRGINRPHPPNKPRLLIT